MQKAMAVKLKPHPKYCPSCKEISITYERFSLKHGEYVCDECGWAMDACTGKVTSVGETAGKEESAETVVQQLKAEIADCLNKGIAPRDGYFYEIWPYAYDKLRQLSAV